MSLEFRATSLIHHQTLVVLCWESCTRSLFIFGTSQSCPERACELSSLPAWLTPHFDWSVAVAWSWLLGSGWLETPCLLMPCPVFLFLAICWIPVLSLNATRSDPCFGIGLFLWMLPCLSLCLDLDYSFSTPPALNLASDYGVHTQYVNGPDFLSRHRFPIFSWSSVTGTLEVSLCDSWQAFQLFKYNAQVLGTCKYW